MKYNAQIVDYFLNNSVIEFANKKKEYEHESIYWYLVYRTEGNTIDDSCILAILDKDTIYAWKKKFKEFSDSDKKAEMYFKRYHIQKISSNSSWQSSAWLLERRYPEEYGMRQKLEHSGEIKTNSDIKDLVNELTRIREQISNNSENNS